MPKGDRAIWKADCADGYARISNLILEALAMANLTGVQKGICFFLFRRTYSWGKKEDEISLREFAAACNSSESYISRQLKKLTAWKVIIRTSSLPGKASTFTFNTRMDEWDKACLDRQLLSTTTIQGLYRRTRHDLSSRTTPEYDLNPAGHDPVIASKEKDKENIKIFPNNPPDNEIPFGHNQIQIISTAIEQKFGRRAEPHELKQLSYFAYKMDTDVICAAIDRAHIRGKPRLNFVIGILKSWLADGVTDFAGVKQADYRYLSRKNSENGGEKHGRKSAAAPPGCAESRLSLRENQCRRITRDSS